MGGPSGAAADGPAAPILDLVAGSKIAQKQHGFDEPSGLALASDDDHYWSVSDNSGTFFLVSPTGKLKLFQSIQTNVKGLEGVTEDRRNHRLLAVC